MYDKNVWWKEYRNRPFKREKISTELIIRKSFRDTLKEYATHSSLSCVKEIANQKLPKKNRTIMFVILCIMTSVTCYFLYFTWSGTLSKPLIVTMESSTYPISNIDFPAVALCNANRISKKALIENAKKLYPYVAHRNETLDEVIWFYSQLGRLLDFSWDDALSSHPFMVYTSVIQVRSRIVLDKMQTFAPKCEEMLIKCGWGGDIVDCKELFVVRRTARGHCCLFNYVLAYNSGGRAEKTIAKVKSQTEPGISNGLTVILDPLVEDYAYSLDHLEGFNIFLFDPKHFPDPSVGRVTHRIVEKNTAIYLELKSVKQVATDEVRKYRWKTRNCLFHDERPEFRNMYSYSTCLVNCKIRTVQTLCKCTPYYLPENANNTAICTLNELRCLNKYKEKLLYMYPSDVTKTDGLELEIQDSLYCPECLPDCEFTKHYTRASKIPVKIHEDFTTKQWTPDILKNTSLTNKCLLNIYQSTSDGILDRLDVVSYWFEILSTFGGFAGIVIGFSIISIVEIIYFFCIRFYQRFYKIYQEFH